MELKLNNMKINGIYKITNLINGKMYIGKSTNIYKRWYEHKKLYLTLNSHLYYSMRKYGIDNFSFEIIKETNELDYWEMFYIKEFDTINNGLNMTTGGNGGWDYVNSNSDFNKIKGKWNIGKVRTEEQRQHLSKKLKGIKKSTESLENYKKAAEEKVKNYPKEYFLNKAQKAKETRLKNGGYIVSEEARRKSSITHKEKNINCKQIICNETGQIFKSINEAEQILGISRKKIGRSIANKPISEKILKSMNYLTFTTLPKLLENGIP